MPSPLMRETARRAPLHPVLGPALKGKLPGIQILRAAAALMVVVWHVGGIAKNFEDIDVTPPSFLMFGYAGVELFFVLSGYIICRVCSSREFRWKDFARKRFLRIYPFYALFSVLALLAWIINPAWNLGDMGPTASSIVDSFFILPQQHTPVLFVGWSLQHEVQFYLVVAVLFALQLEVLLPLVLFAIFFAGILVHAAFGINWSWLLLSPSHLDFALGALVFFWREPIIALGWRLPLVGGVVLFCATAAVTPESSYMTLDGFSAIRTLGFGLGSCLLLIAATNTEFSSLHYSPALAILLAAGVYLGDASYTLYLSHPFVLSLTGKLGVFLDLHGVLVYALLVASVILACLFASAFYGTIERRILQRLDPPETHAPRLLKAAA